MAKTWDGIVNDGGFSDDDEKAYNEAMDLIREGLAKGLGFDEACRAVPEKDPELKRLIADDFLKVTIANLHFEKEMPVEAVAEQLGIQVERVLKARQEMIEEVRDRSLEYAREKFGDIGAMFKDAAGNGEEGPGGNA